MPPPSPHAAHPVPHTAPRLARSHTAAHHAQTQSRLVGAVAPHPVLPHTQGMCSWLRLSTEESDRKHCGSVEQDQMQGLLVPMAGKVATDDWVRIGAALAAADFSQLMVQCYIDVSAYGARAGGGGRGPLWARQNCTCLVEQIKHEHSD